MQLGGIGQKPRDRGLAGAGRPPENQRAQRARRQHTGQRAVGSENMVLTDNVGEFARAQFVGKRMRRILLHPCRGKEIFRPDRSLRAHPPSVTLICWPPRTTTMRHSRVGSRVAFSRSLVLTILVLLTARTISP